MNKINKLSGNTKVRNTIYAGAGIGLSGNSFLLLFHILMFIRGQRPRLTDLPISLLALIHILMLLVVSLVASDIFMPGKKWSDSTCKFVMFLYRSFRSLSLCATSLLSILQAITLSLRSSRLAKFKCKSPHHMLGCLLFLSIFYSSISSPLITYITVTPNLTSSGFTYLSQSCCVVPMSYSVHHTFFILLTSRDVIFVGLMTLSSGYMVIFLCRHKNQSQLLHSASLSLRPSAEQRATRTILCLMSFFMVMYTLDSVISYLRSIDDDLILFCVHILTVHGYATVSRYLVLSTEKHISNIFRSIVWKDGQHHITQV
ncbi:vomeronasal type-1 receptor 54-like [Meriones unguiculatus]|uniref:vomeronasal type-1 receptor 54-like n=1 Tax=Meriones unguiculatus TaxID=10047 RepID=UPI00293EB9F8|nr:vomeronasal type-1 receptor 54-like [Meriones unguiculatus]XP_060239321.1 vomeronasal type-1 receptor 54-like [Meriones unguiculatus]